MFVTIDKNDDTIFITENIAKTRGLVVASVYGYKKLLRCPVLGI